MIDSEVDGHPEAKLGSVGNLDDGRSFVLFERRLSHSIEKVWQAITDPEQRAKWAPGFEFELFEGAELNVWFGGECDGPAHMTGTVTVFDPPNVLQCGSMRFELETDGDGCLLKFSDILAFKGPLTKVEFTNSVLAGWHVFMDALEQALDGKIVNHGLPEFDYSKIEIPGRCH